MSALAKVHFANLNWGETLCGRDLLGDLVLKTTQFAHLVTCLGCLARL